MLKPSDALNKFVGKLINNIYTAVIVTTIAVYVTTDYLSLLECFIVAVFALVVAVWDKL